MTNSKQNPYSKMISLFIAVTMTLTLGMPAGLCNLPIEEQAVTPVPEIAVSEAAVEAESEPESGAVGSDYADLLSPYPDIPEVIEVRPVPRKLLPDPNYFDDVQIKKAEIVMDSAWEKLNQELKLTEDESMLVRSSVSPVKTQTCPMEGSEDQCSPVQTIYSVRMTLNGNEQFPLFYQADEDENGNLVNAKFLDDSMSQILAINSLRTNHELTLGDITVNDVFYRKGRLDDDLESGDREEMDENMEEYPYQVVLSDKNGNSFEYLVDPAIADIPPARRSSHGVVEVSICSDSDECGDHGAEPPKIFLPPVIHPDPIVSRPIRVPGDPRVIRRDPVYRHPIVRLPALLKPVLPPAKPKSIEELFPYLIEASYDDCTLQEDGTCLGS